MRKDPTEFRARFKAYQKGKMPYDAGRPVAIQEVDQSDADFAKRLRSNWRQEIWDWEGSGKAVTHKIGSSDNIVYPNVQTTEGGGLIDFTNPIWKGVVDPRQRAIQNNDFVPMKTESDAIWFGPNYKKYYPGFKSGKLPRYGDGTTWYDQLNDSFLGTVVKAVDPTGVSSWYDVAKAYGNYRQDSSASNLGALALEAIGAIPIIGKTGKAFRAGYKLNAALKQQKLARTIAQRKAAEDAIYRSTADIQRVDPKYIYGAFGARAASVGKDIYDTK